MGGSLLQQFALDGQVLLRYKKNPSTPEWADLAQKTYRWLVGQCFGGHTGPKAAQGPRRPRVELDQLPLQVPGGRAAFWPGGLVARRA